MNIKKIKELIELMNENELSEIEIEQEGMKIKLTKKAHGVIDQTIIPLAEGKEVTLSEQRDEATKAGGKNVKEVKAPMVGTFYRAPSPDVDSYVEVGDIVKKGDVLCIVEAMKLMNEVKAEFGGKIVEISVENAEPVEYGQTIFLIEPA